MYVRVLEKNRISLLHLLWQTFALWDGLSVEWSGLVNISVLASHPVKLFYWFVEDQCGSQFRRCFEHFHLLVNVWTFPRICVCTTRWAAALHCVPKKHVTTFSTKCPITIIFGVSDSCCTRRRLIQWAGDRDKLFCVQSVSECQFHMRSRDSIGAFFWIVFLTEHKIFDILSVLIDTHRTRSAAARLPINRTRSSHFL